MGKHKFLIIIVLCIVLFSFTSCKSQNQFELLEKNDCCVYQYKTKDKYFAKYKDYHVFENLNEIEYKNFTIFILNEKKDSMPEELSKSLLELFKEPNKIIFIKGNSDKIKYEYLFSRYNWNSFGEIGSEVGFYNPTSNLNESKVSNDKLFFYECVSRCKTIVQNYIKML
jgi:hypothetical protein